MKLETDIVIPEKARRVLEERIENIEIPTVDRNPETAREMARNFAEHTVVALEKYTGKNREKVISYNAVSKLLLDYANQLPADQGDIASEMRLASLDVGLLTGQKKGMDYRPRVLRHYDKL